MQAKDGQFVPGEGTDSPKSNWTENAMRVLRARYLKKNESGQPIEAPEDLFRRVASTIAEIERR